MIAHINIEIMPVYHDAFLVVQPAILSTERQMIVAQIDQYTCRSGDKVEDYYAAQIIFSTNMEGACSSNMSKSSSCAVC